MSQKKILLIEDNEFNRKIASPMTCWRLTTARRGWRRPGVIGPMSS